jgi:hypothetical protein
MSAMQKHWLIFSRDKAMTHIQQGKAVTHIERLKAHTLIQQRKKLRLTLSTRKH